VKHFIIAIIALYSFGLGSIFAFGCATTMTPQQALDQAVLAQECMDILAECVTEGKAAQSDEEILDAFSTCFSAVDESGCMIALYDELESLDE
jgi:hypothetical protein